MFFASQLTFKHVIGHAQQGEEQEALIYFALV